MVSPIPTSSHRYRGQALGMAPKLIQGSSVLFCDVTGLPVRYKSQNRKQALISSPTSQGKQKALPACAGLSAPKEAGGVGEELCHGFSGPGPGGTPWSWRPDLQDERQGGEGGLCGFWVSAGPTQEECSVSNQRHHPYRVRPGQEGQRGSGRHHPTH